MTYIIISSSPQGNVTFSCAEQVSVAVTFTHSQSFLQLPGLTSWSSGVVSMALQFRTWNKAGLLLTFNLLQKGGTVWLYLSEGRLRLQINKAGRAELELSAGWSKQDFAELHLQRGTLRMSFSFRRSKEEVYFHVMKITQIILLYKKVQV